jgi:hypothetical protein
VSQPPQQPWPAAAAEPHLSAPVERCPHCDATLVRAQDWCLQCGTAARTRLAPTPNWRAPLAFGILLVAVALAVLTAALATLAG